MGAALLPHRPSPFTGSSAGTYTWVGICTGTPYPPGYQDGTDGPAFASGPEPLL